MTLQHRMHKTDPERTRRFGAVKLLAGTTLGFIGAYGIYWLTAIGNTPGWLALLTLIVPVALVLSGLCETLSNRPCTAFRCWHKSLSCWPRRISTLLILAVLLGIAAVAFGLFHVTGLL